MNLIKNRNKVHNFFEENERDYLNFITQQIRQNKLNLAADDQCLQYFLPAVHDAHLSFCDDIYNSLNHKETYLNIGAGCGYLEKVFLDYNNPNIIGADMAFNDSYFSYWRNILGVNRRLCYDTGDLFADNISITNRDTGKELDMYFDNIIGIRFNGFWRSTATNAMEPKSLEEIVNFFKMLKKYGSNVVLHMVGDGSQEKFLPETITWLNENTVNWINLTLSGTRLRKISLEKIV